MENDVFDELEDKECLTDGVTRHFRSRNSYGDSNERTLKIVANIILIAGVIVAIYCLSAVIESKEAANSYYDEVPDKASDSTSRGVIAIGVFLASLASWALLRVFANISLNLKEINSKISSR